MIKFIGKNNEGVEYEINLSQIEISFIEENNLFYDYLVKSYTQPFQLPINNELIQHLGITNETNATFQSVKIEGKLLFEDTYKNGFLHITEKTANYLECVFYYGEETLEVLSKNLNEINFETVTTTDLTVHAKEQLSKSYPEVDYNFPMVFNPWVVQQKNYGLFRNYINNYETTTGFLKNEYTTNDDGEQVPGNYNTITPMPYLLSLVKKIFEPYNYTLLGSFFSEESIEKTIVYTNKKIEQFQSGISHENYNTSFATQKTVNGFVVDEDQYKNQVTLLGDYEIFIKLNFPTDLLEFETTITYDGEEIFRTSENATTTLKFTATEVDKELVIFSTIHSRSPRSTLFEKTYLYGQFNFTYASGDLNTFPLSFNLAEVLPNISVATFLNSLKNFFNLEISLANNVLQIDFIEQKFNTLSQYDERKNEVVPLEKFNEKRLFRLKNSKEEILVNKNGLAYTTSGLSEEEISEIDAKLHYMEVNTTNGIRTAEQVKENETDVQLLFYDGLQGNIPTAIDNVGNKTYSLSNVYSLYWKKWLHFRLNSKIFIDLFKTNYLPSNLFSFIRHKYQLNHLYKIVKRKNIGNGVYEIEIESESL